jgi:O-antigen/teichoic acid export membrane protein
VPYLLLAAGAFLIAPVAVNRWIHLSQTDSDIAVKIIRILSVGTLIALPRSLYCALCRAIERTEFSNSIDVAMAVLQQGGAIALLFYGWGVEVVISWMSLTFIVGTVAYMASIGVLYSWSVVIPGFTLATIKRNRTFILNLTGISFLTTGILQTDKTVASKTLPVGTFGYYSFLSSVFAKAMTLTGAVSQAALPSLASAFSESSRVEIGSKYKKLQDLLCFVAAPVYSGVFFALLPVFDYLFKPGIGESLEGPAFVLALATYMNATLHVPYWYSLAVGRPDIAMKANVWGLLITVASAIVLTHQFGLIGTAGCWLTYNIFAYLYTVPILCRECLRIPVLSWYLHVARYFMTIAVSYGSTWILATRYGSKSEMAYAVAYLGGSAIFLSCSWFVVGVELREALRRAILKGKAGL